MLRITLLFLACAAMLTSAEAQDDYPYPSLSPKGTIAQVVGNTRLQVEYERPSARGRQVFGSLVPYNSVWRTGAGHCTKISFDHAVMIKGQEIPAGTYSLFTIPNPGEWIVILNQDTTLYGSYDYNYEKDVARFVVIPQKSHRFYETLNMDIELVANNAELYIAWAHTQIHFRIVTSTEEQMSTFIAEELLSGKSENANHYAGAAEYYFYEGTNLMQAVELAEHAIGIDKSNGWARSLKIRIYEKLNLWELAQQEIERSRAYTLSAEYENESERDRDIQELDVTLERLMMKMERL